MKPKDINKETAIIYHTLDIVYETGIAGLKMSKLAKRVGISPSTLYVYFETKEDLIISIGIKLLRQKSEGPESTFNNDIPFEQKLRDKWTRMFQFLLNNEREVNFLDQWRRSPYFNEKSMMVWNTGMKVKTDLLQEGRDAGILKDLDDNIIFAVMSGIAKQIIELIKQGHLQRDDLSADKIFNIVWDALKR